jgi:hypothetical protein
MTAMASRRFLNPAQPQTLVIAVYLLYLHAVFLLFDLLRLGQFPLLYLAAVAAGLLGGYLIANEVKQFAYPVALIAAISPFAIRLYYLHDPLQAPLLTLMFEIALVALLLHPQSRDYQRIWFK